MVDVKDLTEKNGFVLGRQSGWHQNRGNYQGY